MLAACEEDARDVVCLCAVRNARLRLQRRHRRRRWIISDRRGAKVKGLLPRPERVGLAPPAALPEHSLAEFVQNLDIYILCRKLSVLLQVAE